MFSGELFSLPTTSEPSVPREKGSIMAQASVAQGMAGDGGAKTLVAVVEAPSILPALAGARTSLPISRQHMSIDSSSAGDPSPVTHVQFLTHFCLVPSRQLESSLRLARLRACDDLRLTGSSAFRGDSGWAAADGGVAGGDGESAGVIHWRMDILKEVAAFGDPEPLLAGGVLSTVGVMEGWGKAPVQLGAHIADDGEARIGLLLARDTMAGVLWPLVSGAREIRAMSQRTRSKSCLGGKGSP